MFRTTPAPQTPPDATSEALVLTSISPDGILTLGLNRPKAANALSLALMGELAALLGHAAGDSQVRVIVLKGAGAHFCAGHDLKEMSDARAQSDGGHAFFEDLFRQCAELMQLILSHPKPVIAQVRGLATAAGCQLVASCDLALADDEARFATPGVDIGLFCSTPMVALSRAVARKHAMEMLLTGEPIEARRAAEIGLINKVTKAKELEGETRALAHLIAAKPASVLKLGKEAFFRQSRLDVAEAYAQMARLMAENMLMDEAREGIGAFLEKREPVWKEKP